MKGKKACILICIAAGSCLAAGCAKKHDEDVSVRTDWGMFEWTEEQIEHPEEMAAFAEELEIGRWYQELHQGFDHEETARFVRTMKEAGVSVYALAGSVEWGMNWMGDH